MPVPSIKLGEFQKTQSLCSDLCNWFRNEGDIHFFSLIQSLPVVPPNTVISLILPYHHPSFPRLPDGLRVLHILQRPPAHTLLLAHPISLDLSQNCPIPPSTSAPYLFLPIPHNPPFLLLFIQQICIKHTEHARYSSRFWGYGREQSRPGPVLQGTYVLERDNRE